MVPVPPAVAAGARHHDLGPARYRPPVDAAVADPFRPPAQPWAAGNRGIEYRAAPGAPVVAIGPGRVAFVGPVAGRTVVSVVHPDGLRSSYVGLAVASVSVGQKVAAGEPIGSAAGPLHLGVRRGSRYLDPAGLWGRAIAGGRPILVPDHPARPRWPPAAPLGSAAGGAPAPSTPPILRQAARLWWAPGTDPPSWPWGG